MNGPRTTIQRDPLRPARFALGFLCSALTGACLMLSMAAWADEPATDSDSLAVQRLELMRSRAESIAFVAPDEGFPKHLEPEPLFRYDDHTRGYVDGTVWRLGKAGRPLAIITAELHPRYGGGGPKVVYDFLSLTEIPFVARSNDVPGWSPRGSAVTMKPLPNGPAAGATTGGSPGAFSFSIHDRYRIQSAKAPASFGHRSDSSEQTPRGATEVLRLAQIKRLATRFSGTQEVEGQKVQLRLLPTPIGRYVPAEHERADAAMFLLVNGRNPALILFIENDGEQWSFGIGRLSLPSDLTAKLDGDVVYHQPRLTNSAWKEPYTASNSPATIPGYEATQP